MRVDKLIFIIIICCTTRLVAQNDDCEITLTRATEEFNGGHFYSIPTILDPCIKSFTTEQRQRAYLLLTQTYLLLDDATGAKQSYLSLLKANPEFLTDTAVHPIDVIYLSKKFTSTAIFSWFGKAGANATLPRLIYDLNQFGETGVSEKYSIKTGYQVAVGGDYNFSDKINARLELQYDYNALQLISKNYWNQDEKDVKMKQNWLSVPLTLAYGDFKGKYRPYGYLGYSIHYLLKENSSIALTNNRPGKTTEADRENTEQPSPDINSTFRRNRFNQSIVVGGGMKVKMGLDFIFIDVRYRMGLKNITSLQNLYGDNKWDPTSENIIGSYEPSLRFADVNDVMRLDNIAISIGFLRPLYKPRELRRARTKSVMKQMKK